MAPSARDASLPLSRWLSIAADQMSDHMVASLGESTHIDAGERQKAALLSPSHAVRTRGLFVALSDRQRLAYVASPILAYLHPSPLTVGATLATLLRAQLCHVLDHRLERKCFCKPVFRKSERPRQRHMALEYILTATKPQPQSKWALFPGLGMDCQEVSRHDFGRCLRQRNTPAA